MNEPQFAWQQEFDGTQPDVPVDEQLRVRTTLGAMTLAAIRANMRAVGLNKENNGFILSLHDADIEPPVEITVKRSFQDDPEADIFVMLRQKFAMPNLAFGRTHASRASLYFIHEGRVVRQDVDTRPTPQPMAEHDQPKPTIPLGGITLLTQAVQNRTAAMMTDFALGFDRFPIAEPEADALASYLYVRAVA